MELSTVGRQFHEKLKMPLWYNPSEDFASFINNESRFKIVLIESGTGVLKIGDVRAIFTSPALFCLNEKDMVLIEQAEGLEARALYFHPKVINSVLNFENIRDGAAQLKQSDIHDIYWLRPFTTRNAEYHGQLPLGPVTAQRLGLMLDAVANQTAQQENFHWPCRSRSYFFEILFLIDNIFSNPDPLTSIIMSDVPGDVNDILLYIHINYKNKITIPDLVSIFHTNKTSLCERFNQATGMPVMGYLNRLRVSIASLILKETKLPVSEIMERVGFIDITHFGRMFRKYTGYTPTQYREMHQK